MIEIVSGAIAREQPVGEVVGHSRCTSSGKFLPLAERRRKPAADYVNYADMDLSFI
jgi:hypothetical protein